MKFEKGYDARRSGRPKGSRNKRTVLREALISTFGNEAGFWKSVTEQAKKGDMQAKSMIANRLIPVLKAETPTTELEVHESDGVSLASRLITMALQGELTPDQLNIYMDSLTKALNIEKISILEERIAELEKQTLRKRK